jgi:hypothetical protein
VTEADGDCDDSNGWKNPLQAEVCDELDNNCNGKIDEDDVCNLESGDKPTEPSCGCSGGGSAGLIGLFLPVLALRRRKPE